jgi:integrase
MKFLLDHVDPHYRAYFTTAFLTGIRPNEMIALKWANVDFEMRCITVREGRVLGIEGPHKTMSSYPGRTGEGFWRDSRRRKRPPTGRRESRYRKQST